MDKYVVVSVEERLVAWRTAEQAAADAEHAVARLGQAAADPRVTELLGKAEQLREEADRQFSAIVRAVKMDEAGQWGDSANEARQDGIQGNSNTHPHR